eukprot:Filipodium_phascolosomae@DN6203_c0_g1_i1.p1
MIMFSVLFAVLLGLLLRNNLGMAQVVPQHAEALSSNKAIANFQKFARTPWFSLVGIAGMLLIWLIVSQCTCRKKENRPRDKDQRKEQSKNPKPQKNRPEADPKSDKDS